jgi:5-formyltetrahydrofolate cyclo-ligase
MSVTAGSDANGAHLTFVASEDFRQTAKVVPSLHSLPADKIALRRVAREQRRNFVQQLGEQEKSRLERQLAEVLSLLLERSRIIGAYCPLPAEISPLPTMVAAKMRGLTGAFPAFADHDSNFRFLAGEPTEPGPWSILQPAPDSPVVHPDLVLLPLVAIDRNGTRLGQGKGHYDRVVGDLRRRGALLIGLGWDVQLINETIPADPWDIPLDGFACPSGLKMLR